MNLIQTVTIWVGQAMNGFDEEKKIVSVLDSSDSFQEAREILWELHELRSYADAKEKHLLNEMVSRLKKYGRFTEPQMQMLRNIKTNLEQFKMRSNASSRPSIEECKQCEGKGMLTAIRKDTGAKYHLRCFCGHADRLSSKIPRWSMDYESMYEAL